MELTLMTKLIPIKYHKRQYPHDIISRIEEVTGHFDKESINPIMDYSLHTEYSAFKKRNLNSVLLKNLESIRLAHKKQIPQLWLNINWSREFGKFIMKLIDSYKDPKIIEIHPPFDDYCSSLEDFLKVYIPFETEIAKRYPITEILIENRYGSSYSGGNFILSTTSHIISFSNLLDKTDMKLKIALDIPQLLSAQVDLKKLEKSDILDVLLPLKECVHNVACIHIWGKKLNPKGRFIAHIGDLSTLFCFNPDLKKIFLSELYDLFNDGVERYFLPEVNSRNTDLESIVNDFKKAGFVFLQK